VYITRCRTYFSKLREWVNRETDTEVLSSITIDSELPEDLMSEFLAAMAMLEGGGE
jgi:hypothetical protein